MLLGYDAVAISANDINSGPELLEETLDKGFPWISANLHDKNGQLVTKPYVIKTVNSLKVAIIGLTDTPKTSSKYTIIDFFPPLTTLVQQLTTESDVIILLSNFHQEINQKIATQFSDIDIILSSDKALGKMAPKVVNNTLLTQTSSRGKYLGKLEITWNFGETWHNNRLLPLPVLIKRKITVETQLTQLLNNTKNSNKQRILRLERQQQRLIKEIARREELESAPGTFPPNKHTLRFIPVQPTHSPDSIETIVDNIDKTIKEQAMPK